MTKPTESNASGKLIRLPTDELLRRFGAGHATPGSGSASALLALVACKLLQTVVHCTQGRDKYEDVNEQLTLANQKIEQSYEPQLLNLIEEDSIQFGRVIQARQARDKESDAKARKRLREKSLAELRPATEIPIKIAECSLDLASEALVVFDLGYKSARGDSGVAMSAALAGATGALSIVYLNLTSFKGSRWAIDIRRRADKIQERTQKL